MIIKEITYFTLPNIVETCSTGKIDWTGYLILEIWVDDDGGYYCKNMDLAVGTIEVAHVTDNPINIVYYEEKKNATI